MVNFSLCQSRQVKLIDVLFGLDLLKESNQVKGEISDVAFGMRILLAEHVGKWYVVFRVAEDIG